MGMNIISDGWAFSVGQGSVPMHFGRNVVGISGQSGSYRSSHFGLAPPPPWCLAAKQPKTTNTSQEAVSNLPPIGNWVPRALLADVGQGPPPQAQRGCPNKLNASREFFFFFLENSYVSFLPRARVIELYVFVCLFCFCV